MAASIAQLMHHAHLFEIRPVARATLTPQWQGFGFGSACLDFAKSLYPAGIELHSAQQNYGACRLYERHGFIAVTHLIFKPIGIGDIVYRWPGY